MRKLLLFLLVAMASLGCAARKPLSVRFQNCKITAEDQCDCLHARFIGWDAQSKAQIYQCQ